MKKLEFETSKGKFVLVDTPLDAYNVVLSTNCIGVKTNKNLEKDSNGFYHIYSNGLFFGDINIKIELIGFLKQITEEQASEIVDSIDSQVSFKTSLNILLKSKGVHLFKNPAPILHQDRLRQEQNTFYNPYIFKLC